MRCLVVFAVGFVAGWVTRSTVESSHGVVVGVASTIVDVVEWAKRAVATEGDFLEDFVAEVRSRIQDARPWHEGGAGTSDGDVSAGNGGVSDA